jgi:mRNA interferase RelE/StbE
MKYEVKIEKSAAKFVDKLDKSNQLKIRKLFRELEIEPRPHGFKKLVDGNGQFRIRVGNYRIIYTIQDDVLIVTVVRVAKRNENTY